MPLTIEEFKKKFAEDRKIPRATQQDPWRDFGDEIDKYPIHNPERAPVKRGN